MLRTLRTLSRDEDGQALVLAALLLLVVALAVLGTSQIASTVHDRIQLQNAADNAAYSLAVQEARAFNFYAFSNRAQISHYVTILQLLSLDSILLGLLTGLGTLSALMKTAGSLCTPETGYACAGIPYIGPILMGISTAAHVVEQVARLAGGLFLAFDAFVGSVAVPLLIGANLFLFAQQAALFGQVAAKLGGDEALRLARKTAPKAELAGGLFQSGLNLLRFSQAHLQEAALLLGQQDPNSAGLADGAAGKRNYARRSMSELVHATRYAPWVYDRSFPGDLGAFTNGLAGIGQVGTLLDLFPLLRFRGHSRLLSDTDLLPSAGSMTKAYERMEKAGHGTARYPTGAAIGANFYMDTGGALGWLRIGFDQKYAGSVTSTGGAVKGWACTWDPERPYDSLPFGLFTIYSPRIVCDVNKGKHPWWGITPYMAFDASPEGCAEAAKDFCQPDVWVALRQENRSILAALDGQSVATPDGEAPAHLSHAKPGTLHAVSRALTYYHRPGAWREPPNFFNPFWRAKLAPVEPGLERLAADGGLGPLLEALPGAPLQKVWTH